MSVYALCENMVNYAATEPKYIVDVLYKFVQDNPLKIAVDAENRQIIKRYEDRARQSKDLASWLKFVSMNLAGSVDFVKLPKSQCRGVRIYVEVAARLNGPKIVLAWTVQDYVGSKANERGVTVLDRDEAREELAGRASKGDGTTKVWIGKMEGGMTSNKFTTGIGVGVGPGASGVVTSLQAQDIMKSWQEVEQEGIDAQKLADDLAVLRKALDKEASDPAKKPDATLIESAETAARNQDGPGALALLGKVGTWVVGVATTIGATVAAAALRKALGLP